MNNPVIGKLFCSQISITGFVREPNITLGFIDKEYVCTRIWWIVDRYLYRTIHNLAITLNFCRVGKKLFMRWKCNNNLCVIALSYIWFQFLRLCHRVSDTDRSCYFYCRVQSHSRCNWLYNLWYCEDLWEVFCLEYKWAMLNVWNWNIYVSSSVFDREK